MFNSLHLNIIPCNSSQMCIIYSPVLVSLISFTLLWTSVTLHNPNNPFLSGVTLTTFWWSIDLIMSSPDSQIFVIISAIWNGFFAFICNHFVLFLNNFMYSMSPPSYPLVSWFQVGCFRKHSSKFVIMRNLKQVMSSKPGILKIKRLYSWLEFELAIILQSGLLQWTKYLMNLASVHPSTVNLNSSPMLVSNPQIQILASFLSILSPVAVVHVQQDLYQLWEDLKIFHKDLSIAALS